MGNVAINVIKGDITKVAVDAIVNAAKKALLDDKGVDGAIYRAGGSNLMVELQSLGKIYPGEAKITRGYNLPAKFIIHTVGPTYGWENGLEEQILRNCYYNSLDLAVEKKFKSIAFPSISTGAYCYPVEEAAQIAFKIIKEFLERKGSANTLEEITFVTYTDADYKTYRKARDQSQLIKSE